MLLVAAAAVWRLAEIDVTSTDDSDTGIPTRSRNAKTDAGATTKASKTNRWPSPVNTVTTAAAVTIATTTTTVTTRISTTASARILSSAAALFRTQPLLVSAVPHHQAEVALMSRRPVARAPTPLVACFTVAVVEAIADGAAVAGGHVHAATKHRMLIANSSLLWWRPAWFTILPRTGAFTNQRIALWNSRWWWQRHSFIGTTTQIFCPSDGVVADELGWFGCPWYDRLKRDFN
mgnify:CR=1 FL=1